QCFADWREISAVERVAERDEIVGYHLVQARSYRLALGRDDARAKAVALRAGRRLASGGKRAAERDDYDPAQRLLKEAEGLLTDDASARFEALLALVDVLSNRAFVGTSAAARQAEAVAAEIGEGAALRARLWLWRSRALSDPSFELERVRSQIEGAVETFRAANDLDGMLDAVEVLSVADLNAAHWKDAGRWARVGLDVAAEHGLEARGGAFTPWLSNAAVWGKPEGRERPRGLQEQLARE